MEAHDDDTLLTPSEVAAMFRVNPKTVTRWARAGKISVVRTLGGHRRSRVSTGPAGPAAPPAPTGSGVSGPGRPGSSGRYSSSLTTAGSATGTIALSHANKTIT